MDADKFAKYWGNNTPRMHIKGFTYKGKSIFSKCCAFHPLIILY